MNYLKFEMKSYKKIANILLIDANVCWQSLTKYFINFYKLFEFFPQFERFYLSITSISLETFIQLLIAFKDKSF